jgi:hypothetical protein
MLKQKTVYFREEDLPLWENVSNKAQWLHDALTTGLATIPPRDIPRLNNKAKLSNFPGVPEGTEVTLVSPESTA